MATKLSIEPYHPEKTQSRTATLHSRDVGYCTENPREVLQQVAHTHLVARYKGLERITMPEENLPKYAAGLVIVDAYDIPEGLSATSKLSDLKLRGAEIGWGKTAVHVPYGEIVPKRHRAGELAAEALRGIILEKFGYSSHHEQGQETLGKTIGYTSAGLMLRCKSRFEANDTLMERERQVLEAASALLGAQELTTDRLDWLLYGTEACNPMTAMRQRYETFLREGGDFDLEDGIEHKAGRFGLGTTTRVLRGFDPQQFRRFLSQVGYQANSSTFRWVAEAYGSFLEERDVEPMSFHSREEIRESIAEGLSGLEDGVKDWDAIRDMSDDTRALAEQLTQIVAETVAYLEPSILTPATSPA